ncbi:MAG: hypothetical protein LM583_10175 [Desulfurococcaceae archaeon]|nr:hypothetical protein [Desulfurococcaceae archaeon]
MSKVSIPVPIGFDVKGEVGIGSLRTSLHGSPTTTVRQHVIRALYDGTLLSRIDKIVLVDSAGTERDYTTSLSYSISTGTNQATLTITCTISITAAYTVAKVRAYSGTNLYFDTALSTTISVNAGDSASVTLSITISFSGTLTYGTISASASATYPSYTICYRIAQVLSGGISTSYISVANVIFRLYYYGTIQETSKTIASIETLSADGLSVTISCSWQADYDYEIFAIDIQLVDGSIGWSYTLPQTIIVPKLSTVSYSETVSA